MNGAPSSMVSPGLWGFVAFFVLGLALYLLMRNMNARMRRMSYRAEELRREAEAEQAEKRRARDGAGEEASPGSAADRATGEDSGTIPPTGDDEPGTGEQTGRPPTP